MYVYERPTAQISRIFVIIIEIIMYNDRASDPPPPRDVTLSPPRAAWPPCSQCVWGRRPRSLNSPLSSLTSPSSQPRVRAAVRLSSQPLHSLGSEQRSDSRESQSFLPARPRSGKGQGSASPGTRVQFRMDPPQSCPNVVSLQIGRGVTPRPSGALSPGAASTSSTGVSSRAFGLAVAYVSCHWRESRLGR